MKRPTTPAISRRSFLKTTVWAAGALGLPNIVPARVLGRAGATAPNSQLGVAIIGCGNRTKSTAPNEWGRAGAPTRIVAVCDVVADRRAALAAKAGQCDAVGDFRELLTRSDIDVVNVSTGCYWHSAIEVQAAKAGKHLYGEKPLGRCVDWNKRVRHAVRAAGVQFQYGTQYTSHAHVQLGVELVLNGKIGAVKQIYVWCPRGQNGGNATEIPVPPGWDFDLWTGPAPQHPFSQDLCVSKWGAVYNLDFGLGMISAWGSHPLEALQLWADEAGWGIPVEYRGTGQRVLTDLYNTFATWDVDATYANGVPLKFCDVETIQKYVPRPELFAKNLGGNHGTMIVGETGTVIFGGNLLVTEPESVRLEAKNLPKRHLVQSSSPVQNLAEAIRGQTKTITNVESAFRSDAVSHLSHIAILLGRPVKWDATQETIVGDAEAAALLSRPARAPYDKLLEV
jgi:predicted dehydrogenase